MDKKTGVKKEIIFFGNGLLAEYALAVLATECQIVFHAKTKEDLAKVAELKHAKPNLYGVLASFGVLIPQDLLDLFEPEGILNIHPSLLPKYRGASPIESAILAGDNEFSVSVMKLVKAMDAGPIYYQATLNDLPLKKDEIYRALAETGADWIVKNLGCLPEPTPQSSEATFCGKLDKTMSFLTPDKDSADTTLRKIIAFQGYPKPKYAFYGQNCIILDAYVLKMGEKADLTIKCADGALVAVKRLQPEGRKAMDAKSFINGYAR